MNRGEPLRRFTPLVAKSPLRRVSRLREVSTQRTAAAGNAGTGRVRSTGPDRFTVALVVARDEQACFRCGGFLWGERGVAWSVQHRRARGAGGSRRQDTNQPQNLILLCGSATSPGGCHLFVESHPVEARANGWAIRQSDDPLVVPVLHWQRGVVRLTAVGGWAS